MKDSEATRRIKSSANTFNDAARQFGTLQKQHGCDVAPMKELADKIEKSCDNLNSRSQGHDHRHHD